MDRISSMELAISNERTEMEFYQTESARSKNRLAKQMFDTLAADEKAHMKKIGELHQKLVESGEWPADLPLEVSGTDIREQFTAIASDAQSADEHDQDDIAAIRKAISFEAQGAKLYAQLADASANPVEKKFFRFLSLIEREHQLSLNDTLAYFEDPEGWLMEIEGMRLDGA